MHDFFIKLQLSEPVSGELCPIQVDYSIIMIVTPIASFSQVCKAPDSEKLVICWTTVLDQYCSPCGFELLELLLLKFMARQKFEIF